MGNSKINQIQQFIIKNRYLDVSLSDFLIVITGILLFASLLIASCNFITINSEINVTYNDATRIILKTDSIIQKQLLSENPDSLLMVKQMDIQDYKTKDNLIKINDVKRNLFDSNTITFLVSFVLIFLGTILLNIETRATKHVKKAEKSLELLENERKIIPLFSDIQLIQLLSINAKNILISNKHKINEIINILIYHMYFIIQEDLLKDFKENKYRYITTKARNKLENIIAKIIYIFEIDRIREEPENNDKTKPIEDLIEKLNELKDKILEIKIKD